MNNDKQYTESQFNKLVLTGDIYSFCIIDNYGNKTNYFKIDNREMLLIKDILSK
jgi:hypothetical protein